jgi:hypothetical protein
MSSEVETSLTALKADMKWRMCILSNNKRFLYSHFASLGMGRRLFGRV